MNADPANDYPSEPDERNAFWLAHFKQMLVSGVSRRQYAIQTGLKYGRLAYWCQKFQAEKKNQSHSSVSNFSQIKLSNQNPSSPILASINMNLDYTINIHDIAVLKTLLGD